MTTRCTNCYKVVDVDEYVEGNFLCVDCAEMRDEAQKSQGDLETD